MLVSFFVIVFLLVALSFVWPPDSPWSPWWRTSKKKAREACRLAKITSNDIVYELGSGDGEFCLVAGDEFNAKKVIGIEIDHSRVFISKIKKRFSKKNNIEFMRKDFKKVSIKDANVVYFYLVPSVINRLLPKLKKELKPGTRLVSYKYEVPLQLIKKKNDLFLYNI